MTERDPPPLEEPLDMSIKTRKRHSPEDSYNFVKKHRPSVIYFGHSQPGSSSDDDAHSNSSNSGNVPTKNEDKIPDWDPEESAEVVPRRVIITHDENEDGGLEEHFRRSLSKDYSGQFDAEGGMAQLKKFKSCI